MRQKPVQHEKREQQAGVQLLRHLGAVVYELGTRRPAKCRRCGQAAYQGTQQTPGIPDVYAVLPKDKPGYYRALWWEVKRSAGSRVSPEQRAFKDANSSTGIAYLCGPVDALIVWLINRGCLKAEQVPHYRLPKELV